MARPRAVQERVQALRRLEDDLHTRQGRPPTAAEARRALRLRAEAELTTTEIAARMGISPSQAGRTVPKGLRRLRVALQDAGEVASATMVGSHHSHGAPVPPC